MWLVYESCPEFDECICEKSNSRQSAFGNWHSCGRLWTLLSRRLLSLLETRGRPARLLSLSSGALGLKMDCMNTGYCLIEGVLQLSPE